MAGFRGFGDDAMKVKQEQRQAQIQREQIAASERASRRSANVSMAGLQENARQADMADARARKQLEAVEAGRADARDIRREEIAAGTAAHAQDLVLKREELGLRREGLEAEMANRREALGLQTAELSQRERQIQLNEKTAARLDEQYALEQAAREELRREDTATELAVIRAASTSTGPLGMPYINALNNVRGKAYGDPGSVTQVFPVIDPQTGARLGIGTVKIGDDGKPIQSILDPAQTVPRVLASMTPEKQAEYIQTLTGANKARGSDRVTVAALKYAQENRLQFGKTDPASLVKELGEQEDILRTTKAPKAGAGGAADPANQENLDRVKTIKTNVLKTMEEMTSEGGAASAQPKLSPEQKEFVTPAGSATQGAASTPGTGATINKEAGTVTVRIGDQIRTVPDTPALRDWLKKKKITVLEKKADADKPVEKEGDTTAKGDKPAGASPFASSFTTPGLMEDQFVAKGDKPVEKPAQSVAPAPKEEDTEKDVPKQRKEILSRLEKAYRLPNTPDKKQIIRKIKAELDAFNDRYPV